MKVKDSAYKEYAKQAKNRLKNGFWNEIKDKKATQSKINVTTVTQSLSDGSDIKYTTSISNEDELYSRVVEILNSDEVVINPIARLIDKSVYDIMADNQRQQYLLKLSNQYNKLIERYNKENNVK